MLKIKYIFDNLFKIDLANSISNMIIEAYANISHVFIVPGAFHRLRKRIVPLALVPAGHGGWEGECVGGAWEVLSAPHIIATQSEL